MRYYAQKYPEVDELVMVQVRQIAEMGAYVKLVCGWVNEALCMIYAIGITIASSYRGGPN